jgi:hypothetical protein
MAESVSEFVLRRVRGMGNQACLELGSVLKNSAKQLLSSVLPSRRE